MKKRIMLGVYIIYCVRKLRNPFIAEALVFIGLAMIFTYLVSIPNVFANMLNSESFYRYFVIAFSHTDLMVQSVVVLAGVTMLLFVRNITVHAILKTRPA